MRPPQSIIRCLLFRVLNPLTISLTISLLGAPVIAGASSPQFSASPAGLHFRGVEVGQTETLIATVTNNGTTSVTVGAITTSNPAFTAAPLGLPMALAVGQSLDLTVSFTPTATGFTSGTIQLTSVGSSAALMLNVDGGGENTEALTISPPSVSFGQVAVGSSTSVPVVITNSRSWAVTISGTQMFGTGFSMSGANFPLTIPVGQSVTLNVGFSPQSAGEVGGSLTFLGPWMAIPLVGTGTSAVVGQLTVAPDPLGFGSVPVGTTQTQSISVSASGASVTVSSASSTNSEFSLSGATFPFTIPVGQSASFNVAFTPNASGAQSGSLSFVSNASSSKMVESVSGTGTVTSYSVNLYWNSSSDVAGYNVYRSASPSGNFARMNSSLDTTTAYTDSTVASGNTYYYAATSVNSAGVESAQSSPVQATIP
jgi:hypothetical protein